MLASIYPAQQSLLDARRETILDTMSPSDAVTTGIQFGDAVGQAIVARRATDGFMDMVSYAPIDEPGHWQPDPLNPDQSAWGPEWGGIEPFAIPSTTDFLPGEMPSLASQAYADAFNEVKALGAKNSTETNN